MAGAVVAGLLLAAVVGAVWLIGRPLRARPRPPREVAVARYQRLAPVVFALLVLVIGILVIGLAIAALR